MSFLLVAFAAPFAVALVCALALRAMDRRAAILVPVGIAVALAVVAAAYLAAPTDGPPEGCSDCGEYWGRWWEPGLVLVVSAYGFFAWLAGVGVGAELSRLRLRSR